MGFKRRIFDFVTDSMVRGLGINRANPVTCNLLPKISPTYRVEQNGAQLLFCCPNEVTFWRAKTFFTKEPETLEWIAGFKPGDILFDVGANVGLYSVYAAARGSEVVAFEPESQNYALLNRNIYLNQMGGRVTCLNVAISDREGLDYLYLSEFKQGEALHNFGERIDWRHETFAPAYQQGVLSFTLDSFLAKHPQKFPTHIKIDVDGAELKIINGAERTLRNKRLKSLLIEINEALPADQELLRKVESAGFSVRRRPHAPMFDGGQYKDLYNYVFFRAPHEHPVRA